VLVETSLFGKAKVTAREQSVTGVGLTICLTRTGGFTMPALSDDEITNALEGLPAWSRDGDALAASFRRKDWRDALAFVNQIGDEAERRHHHPDVCVTGYRNVALRLTTHSDGGITGRDVSLATWISDLAER
jgi:4a-hydroxytetrahydrobiopterin dehydratase